VSFADRAGRLAQMVDLDEDGCTAKAPVVTFL
jgi:hypothetical protein